jgi:hypothetical protein
MPRSAPMLSLLCGAGGRLPDWRHSRHTGEHRDLQAVPPGVSGVRVEVWRIVQRMLQCAVACH